MQLLLASQSPRRKRILAGLGVNWVPAVSVYEESMPERCSDPVRLAEEISTGKMDGLQGVIPEDCVALTADTLVCQGDRVFGKPADEIQARTFLRSLSGCCHQVITALTLRDSRRSQITVSAATVVTFDTIDNDLLGMYLASKEWQGKAGAYGIQGLASIFIREISGCYWNVVGFPVNLFVRGLHRLGYGFDRFRK